MNGFFKCIAMQEAARVNEIHERHNNGEAYDDLLADQYEAADMGLITYEEADAMEDVYHGICWSS